MIEDPMVLLERLEQTRRNLARGEHMNPAVIEAFIANLARAVVSPHGVDGPRMDYRPRSARAVILARLALAFRIPVRMAHELMWDCDVAVCKVQDEQADLEDQRVTAEIEELERQWWLT